MERGASDVGLGCVTFGREIDAATSHQLLDHAFEQGIRIFDTAAGYGDGASEKILGEWNSKARPDRLMIATKFQPPFVPDRVVKAVGESLERLRGSQLDLLYLHKWDESATSVEFLEALDRVVREGLVREIGISNCDQVPLKNLRAVQEENGFIRFSVLQNNFNYAIRDVNADYREFCASQRIAVVTYSPLGAGFLTGKHKQGVVNGSRFDVIPGHQEVYFHPEAEERLARLENLAASSGQSQAHLALSWAMHQPGIDTVLVGARTKAHIDQAIAARAFFDSALLAEMGS